MAFSRFQIVAGLPRFMSDPVISLLVGQARERGRVSIVLSHIDLKHGRLFSIFFSFVPFSFLFRPF
jgi:hypothetical protein